MNFLSSHSLHVLTNNSHSIYISFLVFWDFAKKIKPRSYIFWKPNAFAGHKRHTVLIFTSFH